MIRIDTLSKLFPTCYAHVVDALYLTPFSPASEEKSSRSDPAYWFIFRGSSLLVSRDDKAIRVPHAGSLADLGLPAGQTHYLGTADHSPCRAAEVSSDAPTPEGWTFEGIRSLFGSISDGFFGVAARAFEVVEWDRTHRYCGGCGSATSVKEHERARECPACGSLSYPRISPAAIVAVVRDQRILLARAHRFPPGFYSVLAGFVEPGETLEQCAEREVREETGIEVKGLRYFASQPWPFPHSLMVAFTAEYAGGEIRVDESEVVDAGWYAADALPSIPDPITVARRLIDWFVASGGRRGGP